MNSMPSYPTALDKAAHTLATGGVISYPTEAVYGLGCDPFDEKAVMKLLAIKQRAPEKGLILVISDWQQCAALTKPLSPDLHARILASWPSHTTWIFPASDLAPAWITGTHKSLAIRMSAHPVVRALCQKIDAPLVSSSANLQGCPAITDPTVLAQDLGAQLDFMMPGALGGAKSPSVIKEALTGDILRS